MSDRDAIFARIRAARERGHGGSFAHPLSNARAALPAMPTDLVAQFRAKAVGLASTVAGPMSVADSPAQIADYLAAAKLPRRAVCWPELAALAWTSAGLEVAARAARADDLVGITGAFCGIAETGTLMLLSGALTPPTVSLLPETHIALLPVTRIVAHMEDAWDLLRSEHANLPRAVNFVSGPSRTADIEQTVTLGAHGPYRVHIVLTSEAE